MGIGSRRRGSRYSAYYAVHVGNTKRLGFSRHLSRFRREFKNDKGDLCFLCNPRTRGMDDALSNHVHRRHTHACMHTNHFITLDREQTSMVVQLTQKGLGLAVRTLLPDGCPPGTYFDQVYWKQMYATCSLHRKHHSRVGDDELTIFILPQTHAHPNAAGMVVHSSLRPFLA